MDVINEEDIYNIVKTKLGHTNFKVITFKSRDKGDAAIGFWGIPTKASIIYEENEVKKLDIFLKLLPKGYQESSTLRMGGFHKEPLLYNYILNDLQKYLDHKVFPDCYLAKSNKFLVLEDLSDLGFKSKSMEEPFDMEHCKAMLFSLAKLHSVSIKFEADHGKLNEIVPYLSYETLISSEKNHPGHNFLIASVNVIDKIIDEYFKDFINLKSKAIEFLKTIPERLHEWKGYQNVLTHGDLWGNNLMYKRGMTLESVIIDFQIARYSLPSQDLLFFLYTSTSKQLRAQYFEYFLKYYYKNFIANLIKLNLDPNIITYKNFQEMVVEIKPTILGLASVYLNFILLPSSMLIAAMKSEEVYRQLYEFDRIKPVMEELQKNPKYRERILNLIEEFLLEINKM